MSKIDQEIIRVESGDDGTFGVWKIDGKAFCVTLEESQKAVLFDSRIPAGVYLCKRVKSPLVERLTHGRWKETFELQDVPGRTDIRVHAGNTILDTLGCILQGQYFGKLRFNRAVLNSGATFDTWMEIMHDLDEFVLTIREV